MFLGIIMDSIAEWFSSLMYGLSQGFLYILYWIETVFKILAGVEAIPGSNQDSASILNLIVKDSITQKLIVVFLAIGLGVFVISLIVGVFKAQIKKDTPGEMKKVIATSLKALFWFAFIPTFFVVFIQFLVTPTLNYVTNVVSLNITGTGIDVGTTEANSIANTLWYRMFSAEHANILKSENANFTYSYSTIKDMGISLKIGDSATSYKYIVVIIVTAIMFWTMGIATIGLAERLINIVFLYLVSPVMIGASPLDGGERLNIWKDKVIVKCFGVMGSILSMYIFLLILGVVGNIVDSYQGNEHGYFILTAVFAIVCIAGAMMCYKGQQLFASLISHNQGQEEGLSAMATNNLASKGLGIAGAGIGGAFMGAKALANKGLGISNPSISQVGKSGGAMAGGALNKASASGGMLNSALQSKNAAAGGGGASTASGGLLNSASQAAGGTSKLNKGLQATAGGMRKVPLVGGLLATGFGLGAAAVKGTGKLLSAPVKAKQGISNFRANRAYMKNANTVRDKAGNPLLNDKGKVQQLSKGNPNRMTYKEAKMARAQENLAKKQEQASIKNNAKQQHQNSIMRQAQKNGRAQARQAMSQKADSILAKKAPELMNPANNQQRHEAKKGIVQALEQGYTGKALKQQIDKAIKDSSNKQSKPTSALSKVGQDGGKK
ncbi:MAG: hypothetical protein IJS58_08985 [Bacilli bacterium]|nr:hypothetical protein [Bacilli bacterium]